MNYVRLYNGKIVLPDRVVENGTVVFSVGNETEEGKIIEVCYDGQVPDIMQTEKDSDSSNDSMISIDVEGCYISPGFVDIHVHGGGGYDFMDGNVDAVIKAAEMHLKHGTTSIYPTSVACSQLDVYKLVTNVRDAIDNHAETLVSKTITGIHLEGPFFNQTYKGAQSEEYFVSPQEFGYEKLIEDCGDLIARWSSAPEMAGVTEMGPVLLSKGILPSIAHSNADLADVQKAFKNGYTHLTHFYNAMSTIKKVNARRYLGVIESGYYIEDMTVEVIADGMHIPLELLEMVHRYKSSDRTALITDAMRGAGMPDGESVLGPLDTGLIVSIHDGVAWMPNNTGFAGSTATMDRLVRNYWKKVGVGLSDAVKMASLTPARIMGIEKTCGSIEVGKRANIILFNDNVEIKKCFVQGQESVC